MAQWHWFVKQTGQPSVGADLKVFRSTEFRQPADFERGPAGITASIFVREVIQNSRDAAQELRKKKLDDEEEWPDFEAKFRFMNLTDTAKAKVVETLDLKTYAETVERVGRDQLDFADGPDWLSNIDKPTEPLRILVIEERGTSGMYGNWELDESKMQLALLSVQETDKEEGEGGSFGYGKSGLVKASGSKTVFAYSCFHESDGDEGGDGNNCSRRAIGVSYWRAPNSFRHPKTNRRHTGWGYLGDGDGSEAVPLTNDEADRIAGQLDIPIRRVNGSDFEGTGTTFVLVEPVITPEDVRKAAEQYWWPAIENSDERFHISVEDYEGEALPVDPGHDMFLKDFVDMYHAARETEQTSPPDVNPDDGESSWQWAKKFKKMPNNETQLGRLALTASNQWCWEKTSDRQSLVALVRHSGMVVEYRASGGKRATNQIPFVRGVFAADEDANQLLQRTEPPLHNLWNTDTPEEDANKPQIALAYKVARTIQKKIDDEVKDFKEKLNPPEDDSSGGTELALINKAFAGKRGRKTPPTRKKQDESLRQQHRFEEVKANDELMRIRSQYTIGIQEDADFENGIAVVAFDYRFLEDDRIKPDSCRLQVTAPASFKQEASKEKTTDVVANDGFTEEILIPTSYKFRGEVRKGSPVSLEILSEPYLKDWTVRPSISYTVIKKTDDDG